MTRNRGTALALVVLMATLPGCILARLHANEPLDRVKIESIERGVTTKEEILARFGPPHELEAREFVIFGQPRDKVPIDRLVGSRFFIYRYTRANGFAVILIIFNYLDGDARSDRLVIFFDADDVVEDYAFATDTDGIPRFGPFSR
jgi:hypothetical protein